MAEEHRPEQLKREPAEDLTRSRKNLLVTFSCAAAACASIIFVAQMLSDSLGSPFLHSLVSNVLAITTSGTALALSLGVIYRQKLGGVLPRLYGSLGLSLGLWVAAESIWAYYEVVAAIETPFPSIADAFWLAGYVPFVYFLVGILRNFVGISRSMILPLLPFVAVGLILIGNILLSLYGTADLSSQDGLFSYAIGSAYPIADLFLIIPAVIAFMQVRKGKLTFTPWVLIVAATMIMTIADIGFAYTALDETLGGFLWVWNPLYHTSYIAIASALFWHKSFFTVDEKKLMNLWQQKYR